jgi:hypothetical protein
VSEQQKIALICRRMSKQLILLRQIEAVAGVVVGVQQLSSN